MSETTSPKRTRMGQWSRGVSGNPSGRPLGSRNRSTLLLEQLLRDQQEALVGKAIELALKGNPVALRLCLERLHPALKERCIELPLPEVTDIAQATVAVSAILTGVGRGQITPGEGAVLAGIVETQKRLLEAESTEQTRQELAEQSMKMAADLDSELRSYRDSSQPPASAEAPPASPQ